MHRFRFPLAILIALTVAVAAAGTGVAKTTGSAAPAKAKTRAQLMAEHRGGTLRLVAKGAGGSLDPQVNYTLQYWQLYQATQDGLVGFKKAQGTKAFTIVPDLAVAIPKPADGGKTWTFKLRKGIKYSTGQTVQPRDFLWTFQRIFKVHTPTAGGFYSVLVGADKCLKTPATCNLSKGVVINNKAGTVTFHLTHAGRRVARQARRAARCRPAVGHAEQGPRARSSRRPPAPTCSRSTTRTTSSCSSATRTSRSGRPTRSPTATPTRSSTRSDSRSRPRSRRSRTARPTGRSTRRRPTASTRSAPSTRTRCTSTRSSRTGTCR